MIKKRVLVLDIETKPMLVWVWALGDNYIGINQIKEDWSVLAWAAKWLGDKPSTMVYRDLRRAKNLMNDKKILLEMRELLNEADIVITQNGEKFDSRKLTARFIQHGIDPPSPYQHIDTYRISKRIAAFTSHKLEYLTHLLNKKYKKRSHKKFVGLALWIACMARVKAAWDEMKVYNIHDVLSTEELFMNLRAYAPNTMPDIFHSAANLSDCTVCGTEKSLIRRGYTYTKTGTFIKYQCKNCFKWPRGEKIGSKDPLKAVV